MSIGLKYCCIVLWLNCLFLCTGCKKEENYIMTEEDSLRIKLTAISDSLEREYSARPPLYKILYPKRGNSYLKLVRKHGYNGADIILALNRIDKKNFKRKDSLVVPDTIVTNWKYYSPFPLKVEEAFQIPKLIVVSQKVQAFAAYQLGNLILWGPTSTGKEETPTPNGLFHTNWKAEETTSTFDDEWNLKWNFNLDNFEGVALHQYEMPGYPASHSCVRLYEKDAEWIYNWAEQWIVTPDEEFVLAYGTPVIIFDEYDFDSPKPWRELVNDLESTKVSLSELEDEIGDYLYVILERKKMRIELIAKRDSIKIANQKLKKQSKL
jgi:lipoprotein-anchoring transpeptidase ErfK/SrfK